MMEKEVVYKTLFHYNQNRMMDSVKTVTHQHH